MNASPKRRLFRYSIRLMLVLVTSFACWLGIQVNWKTNRAAAIDWIDQQALFWDDLPIDQGTQLDDNAPFPLKLMGAPGLRQAAVIIPHKDDVEDKQLELERLFPEADILVACPGTGYKGKHAGLVKH